MWLIQTLVRWTGLSNWCSIGPRCSATFYAPPSCPPTARAHQNCARGHSASSMAIPAFQYRNTGR